ncbi:DUF2510 domain-containing protein [Blastococcus sp. MG754426]|uniref:DUF2510 domain-containing protein n=1 Tax=unclassified Blastococcus TaxID=2619396 RepID=UPI001EF11E22|nr:MULTISPECIES: DUF2510 domain-containing protein [unclassified Blastococcus]MCF6509115.1 DUF2510 domain-containing protein [Blastococcus sp. MG754426]MCF6512913.1 DUF2510 domain-containing protein [Blastococcus sp. MG754427]
MTGAGQDAAPGWYPDPAGTPGVVRWWSGTAWSDVMMPAGPGVQVHRVAARTAVHEPAVPEVPPAPAGRRPRARSWLAAGAVLVLLVAAVVAVLGTGAGGDGADATAPDPDIAPVPAPGDPFPPGTVRIVDEVAGISYPYLGEGWSEFDLGRQLETTATAGQYFTTQEATPDGGIFISQCTSGPVAEGYGWGGPSTLQSTVTTLAASVRANYYPRPNTIEVRRDEPRTVDGRPAHLLEFQLTWDVEGYDASGERAALLLIDVGRPAPALLYVSIPNTHAELYGVIDRVVADVDVL